MSSVSSVVKNFNKAAPAARVPVRFAQDDRLWLRARECELLRPEAGRNAVARRWILHERSRCFGDVDVPPRIDRQIVRATQLSRTDAGSTKLTNHLEVRPSENRDDVRAAVGTIDVRLRNVVREAE